MNTTKAAIGAVSEQNFIQLGISVLAIFLENKCSRIQIILCVVYCTYIMIQYCINIESDREMEKRNFWVNEKEKAIFYFILFQFNAERRAFPTVKL